MKLHQNVIFIFTTVFFFPICHSLEENVVNGSSTTENLVSTDTVTIQPNLPNLTATTEPLETRRLYIKKDPIVQLLPPECIMVPRGETVPRIIGNDDYERTVVYMYKFKGPNGKRIVHIPGRAFQTMIPDMPYTPGDVLVHTHDINQGINERPQPDYGNQNGAYFPQDITVDKIVVPPRNPPVTDRPYPTTIDVVYPGRNPYGYQEPQYNGKPNIDVIPGQNIYVNQNPPVGQTNVHGRIPNRETYPYTIDTVMPPKIHEYIPNQQTYPYGDIHVQNTMPPKIHEFLPNNQYPYRETPMMPPRQHGHHLTRPKVVNIQILKQPMLIKILRESGMSENFRRNFDTRNVIFIPIVERLSFSNRQIFYLQAIGIASKNPMKILTIVPLKQKYVLYEMASPSGTPNFQEIFEKFPAQFPPQDQLQGQGRPYQFPPPAMQYPTPTKIPLQFTPIHSHIHKPEIVELQQPTYSSHLQQNPAPAHSIHQRPIQIHGRIQRPNQVQFSTDPYQGQGPSFLDIVRPTSNQRPNEVQIPFDGQFSGPIQALHAGQTPKHYTFMEEFLRPSHSMIDTVHPRLIRPTNKVRRPHALLHMNVGEHLQRPHLHFSKAVNKGDQIQLPFNVRPSGHVHTVQHSPPVVHHHIQRPQYPANAHVLRSQAVAVSHGHGHRGGVVGGLLRVATAPVRLLSRFTPVVPQRVTLKPCTDCVTGDISVMPRIIGGRPVVASGRPIKNRGRS